MKDGQNDIIEPCKYAYSYQQMQKWAMDFMVATYGPVLDSSDKEIWYSRLGMLIDFISGPFPMDKK